MYALALALSAGVTVGTVGMPFFQLGAIGPIQSFGLIVAAGVLIGAAILRRYAEWHGVSDDHIRGLLGWVTITGFIGAHEFDMIAYNWDRIGQTIREVPPGWFILPDALWVENWPLPLRLWDGISSYGGFLGGAMGFAFYVWWKRLPVRLFADITIVGLLPAFSIGRIACTVVSDHIGRAVDPNAWYAGLAMEYPTNLNMDAIRELLRADPAARAQETILAWNLGFIELLYLIPVNAVVLWLAFRPAKRLPAGFLVVLSGVLYAPVRFFLDYLRLNDSDPRHFGFTFAQWSSILAFAVAVYAAARILKNGTPAVPVTRTSREAQERLRVILKEDEEAAAAKQADKEKPVLKNPRKPKQPDQANRPPSQTSKTEYTTDKPGESSPSIEQPADEGAEVDRDEALAARKGERDKP